MRQEEIDELLKKIEKSAQDVPIPESLEPEQMMEKLKKEPNHKKNRRRTAEYCAVAAAALVTILAAVQIQNATVYPEPQNPTGMEAETTVASAETEAAEPEEASRYTAKSYDDIYEKIRGYRQDNRYSFGFFESAAAEETMAGAGSSGNKDGSSTEKQILYGDQDFSDTNIQVEGVDEGDVVKTDGTYLYILSQSTGRIQIVEANGSKPRKRGAVEDTSTVEESKSIREFYIYGDTMSVIRQGSRIIKVEEDFTQKQTYDTYNAYPRDPVTYLETYDIRDRNHPKLIGTVSQEGYFKNSRRVDDYVYLFTNYCADEIGKKKDIGSYVPAVNEETLPYDCVYIPDNITGAGYIVVTSVNRKQPTKAVAQKAVMADGELFYISPSNIYIGSTRYDEKAAQYDYTELIKLAYDDGRITFKAHGNADGYINNQFSMDEYQGNLRVVSTLSYSSGKSTNSLLVLDEDLKRIGEIEDLAPGEQIYSARFMGDIGYFVTFRNMDPLFSVDLSDPKKPKLLGELKITGFSEYLHPYKDGLLLGIGREISPDTGNFKGLKLSMFDTSDPKDVREVQKMVQKTYEQSPAWYDHKAVTISSRKNLIGFVVADDDKETRTWKYRYVIYSYDIEKGFHQEMAYTLDDDCDADMIRGIYINSWFYVVDSEQVTVFNLDDFAVAGQLKY